MSCSKCKKTSCVCKKNSNSSNEALLSDIQDQLNDLSEASQFLLHGHPILLIEHADDIDQFDLSSGLGQNYWTGWALCNGGVYYNTKLKKNIATPDFTDRFVVMAGGAYAVDDIGGLDSVSLTAAQNGQHNHNLTDPGHAHNITDPGHHHAVTDAGHSHAANAAPHIHTLSINSNGDHNHQYAGQLDAIGNGGTGQFAPQDPIVLNNTSVNGAHTHTGTADATTVAVDIDDAYTGIHIDDDITGITTQTEVTGITVDDSGTGDAHENRPPYYAAFYIMKFQ